ncbi:Nucleoskeletal protein [Trifolium repens]|nr:Nucleoskeletal protein [Trifolium repens]
MEIDIDMVMDVVPDFIEFSNFSNSTTTPTSDEGITWSPLLDLDLDFFTTNQDDFHHFIDSLTNDEIITVDGNLDKTMAEQDEEEGSMGDMSNSNSTNEEDNDGEDRKGLRLVHLLMAAAEALTGTNKSHHLAQVILIRLKDLVSSTHGTNMERLAAYFTDALQTLLNGADTAHGTTTNNHHNKLCLLTGPHQTDLLSAFQLLQDMSPYVKFAHFTANQAILEAVTHERRVHIVDYDIMEGAQWASLIQSLSSRNEGLSGPHLRITALSRNKERGSGRRTTTATVQETGRRLTSFAASVGQPFTFHQCRLDSDEIFRGSSLKLVRGEALVFNCVMHLPHLSYRASDSIASFFNGAKELGSKLVTLVEEEVGPTSDGGFVDLFMDSLHRYSAMYDSLHAGFPMNKWARSLVEQVFLGPRIMGSVAQLFMNGEEEEKVRGSWGEWLGAEGFKGVTISYGNHCQSKLLLGLFNDGYRVEEMGNNKLVLGWKSRPLLSTSIWTCMSKSEFDF